MQGKPVVANVIRKKAASTTIVAQASAAATTTRRVMPGALLQYNRVSKRQSQL